MMGMGVQYKIINACLAAKMKLYFFVADWLLEVREIFKIKHDVRSHLTSEDITGLEWTSICCNASFEMGVGSGFFQSNWKDKTVVLLHGGNAKWVACTLDTAAIAVVRAIEKPDVTRNRILLAKILGRVRRRF